MKTPEITDNEPWHADHMIPFELTIEENRGAVMRLRNTENQVFGEFILPFHVLDEWSEEANGDREAIRFRVETAGLHVRHALLSRMATGMTIEQAQADFDKEVVEIVVDDLITQALG